MDHNMGTILKRDGNTKPHYLSPDKYVGQETTVRTGHGTRDGFKTGKGVCRTYSHPAYLTYIHAKCWVG